MAETKTGKMAEGILTDDMIESMRQKVGSKMRLTGYINNEEATATAIRRFADGIGDSNPLWRDEKYARKTRYGCIVAPPSWVSAVCANVQMGWPGLGGFRGGTDYEFYKPILIGDRITPEVVYLGFDGPMPSQFAERIIKDHYENRYCNQKGELVAKLHAWVFRYERKKAHEKGRYKNIQVPHPWTEEELKGIEEEAQAEEIRGACPRYWEDVSVGEQLKTSVQGPLGLTDMIAFIVGGAFPARMQAHGVALREYRQHPAWAFRDPETHALEPVFAVHYNKTAANLQGVPYCYDIGIQRQCWQDRFVTNWAGDDAWLKRSYAEYRSFVYLSDVVRISGSVTKKYVDQDDEYCVDIEMSMVNQRGENVMPGSATVALPQREKGISPVDGRLGRRRRS